MKTKVKEIKYPHQGDYMLPKLYYVPMVKLYWFLPWMVLVYDHEFEFDLIWTRKPHEVFITSTDAQELIDKYLDEKTYGRFYIKTITYADGHVTYCPMVNKGEYDYSIIEYSNYMMEKTSADRYELLSYENEYNSRQKAQEVIDNYLLQEKAKTVVYVDESPYKK